MVIAVVLKMLRPLRHTRKCIAVGFALLSMFIIHNKDLLFKFTRYSDTVLVIKEATKINFENISFYRQRNSFQTPHLCLNGSIPSRQWNNTSMYYQFSKIQTIMRNPKQENEKVGCII